MQQKKKYLFRLSALILLCGVLSGCGFQKEVLLEYSGHTWEAAVQKGEDSRNKESQDEEVQVITGQITRETVSNEKENGGTTSMNASDPDMIYVHICGQVVHPGVYQVPADARVFSVIQMAGGLTEEAAEAGVNQAQTLVDGQMIYVPASGEEVSGMTDTNSTSDSAGNGKVNINTADLETLMGLPGIGEGKARSILQYRQEQGAFRSIEEIMNVDGIKEGTYSKFKDQITI